jgi:vanillate O-demethylase monooxygenase subunit
MNAMMTAGAEAPAYLRNAWYATAWNTDLQDTPLAKTICEEEILLYRRADGSAVALGNRCPHRFVELHRGKIVGDNIQCAYHGLQFNPSGACAHNPHANNLPAAARIRSYPVEERHRLIWLWMGDADLADPDLIPDFSILTDAQHAAVYGTIHIAADYQLYSDNLMDLSHTEYVHSFQEADSLDRSTSDVRMEGDMVLYTREFPEEPAVGPLHAMFCESMGGKRGDLVRISQSVRWIAPANMVFKATQTYGNKQASLSALHIAVPTRRGECQLLWSGVRDFWIDDEQVSDRLRTTLDRVISTEDIPPIESQQTYIRNRDFMSLRPVLLPPDNAPVMARRALERMIKDERNTAAERVAAQ